MNRIVECVPNISNGTHPEIYNTVAKACEKIPGVKLLDVDPGRATNRTVITFAGAPEVIVDAAFEVIKLAKEMIDMRGHTGEHARMGACDVCPFVPVSGVTLEDCAELARKLGKRVAEELGVWAYLYEAAASKPEWKSLTNVRMGEYEGLQARMGKPEWKPDFGDFSKFDPKFGAVAIGSRKFLVAYNINMNSTNKKLANEIASNIRETGKNKRQYYPDGPFVKNPDGTNVKEPGLFSHCKAGAWIIPEYNRAQITMNLTDTDVTPVHTVFDVVEKQAFERGMRVTGSEIVGLVPLKALTDAGKHFLKKQGLSSAVSEKELVRTAILSLGLNDVAQFKPEDKIVEWRLARKGRLVDMTVDAFSDTLASDAPAPGGGSVAALCANLAASLATMVSNLTFGKKDYKSKNAQMEEIGLKGQSLKAFFLDAIDKDTDSFNKVMDAGRLPKDTDEQKKARDLAIDVANKESILVPLSVLERTVEVLPLLMIVATEGNKNCASDAGVGAYCLLTGAEGAAMNVKINLKNITDENFKGDVLKRMDKALAAVRKEVPAIVAAVEKNLI